MKKASIGTNATSPWGAINFWDIGGMRSGGVDDGLTPNVVSGTCNVTGKVYDEYAVNYWLAGLLYNELRGIYAGIFQELVYLYTSLKTDNGAEKRAWFAAGVAGHTSLPSSPIKYQGLLPGKIFSQKLGWSIGSLSGND